MAVVIPVQHLCDDSGCIASSELGQLRDFQSNINQWLQHDAGLAEHVVLLIGVDVQAARGERMEVVKWNNQELPSLLTAQWLRSCLCHLDA